MNNGIGRLGGEAPEIALSDDATARAGFGGVGREGFDRIEVLVALGRKLNMARAIGFS